MTTSHRITRRQFVHSAATAGAALMPGGLLAASPPAGPAGTAATKSSPPRREKIRGVWLSHSPCHRFGYEKGHSWMPRRLTAAISTCSRATDCCTLFG